MLRCIYCFWFCVNCKLHQKVGSSLCLQVPTHPFYVSIRHNDAQPQVSLYNVNWAAINFCTSIICLQILVEYMNLYPVCIRQTKGFLLLLISNQNFEKIHPKAANSESGSSFLVVFGCFSASQVCLFVYVGIFCLCICQFEFCTVVRGALRKKYRIIWEYCPT